jgi:hypothetical protein
MLQEHFFSVELNLIFRVIFERREYMEFLKAVSGPPLIRRAAAAAVLLLVAAFPCYGSAEVEISGHSATYLQSRETVDGSGLLPLYEYLNFNVQNLGKESVSFHFGGWVRYDLGDDSYGKDKNSDLQYAYLSYRHSAANAVVNLGRVMVFEGVAAERVDGAYARTDLKAGFGISAYGGTPVMTNEGDDSGSNSIYGARVSHTKDGLYTVGLSYLKQEKNSADFREEQGVDLWVRPFSKVELMGRSAYNAITKRWMQDSFNLLLGPFAKLRFNTEFSWIDYESYFAAVTNNAFTFQPGGPLDPKEQLTVLGETVSYAFSDQVSASVDYKQYGYDIAGNASYYGAGLRYSAPQSMGCGLSVHRMDGETERLSYDEYRVYAFKKYGHADVTVDLFDVKYDTAINGVTSAYSASVAAGYDLTESLKLGADVEYAKNPDYDKEVRAFLKLIYRFHASLGKGKGV